MEGRKVRGECERIKGAKGKEGGGKGKYGRINGAKKMKGRRRGRWVVVWESKG